MPTLEECGFGAQAATAPFKVGARGAASSGCQLSLAPKPSEAPVETSQKWPPNRPTNRPQNRQGGETEALSRLEASFADPRWVCAFEKPATDPSAFDRPATTVLSPYLKFGCLSARWGRRGRGPYRLRRRGLGKRRCLGCSGQCGANYLCLFGGIGPDPGLAVRLSQHNRTQLPATPGQAVPPAAAGGVQGRQGAALQAARQPAGPAAVARVLLRGGRLGGRPCPVARAADSFGRVCSVCSCLVRGIRPALE